MRSAPAGQADDLVIHPILIGAILVIGIVFVGLTVAIVANKWWRDRRERRRRRRRERLEPAVAAYARGEHDTLAGALGAPPVGRDRPVLEAILLDRIEVAPEDERRRLVQAAEGLGLVDEYLERLRARSAWQRAVAAERLGRAGAARAIPALSTALDDDSAEVRLRAAHALGRLGGEAALRPLVRALSEPNRWSTIRIADILTSRGVEVLVELIEAFPTMNLHARLAALDILGGIGAMEAGPWLRQRLRDAEPDVRSRASHALGAVGDLDAGPSLIEALRDESWPVRAMAARSLGTILHLPAIPALCRALRDRAWWVRTNAAEALMLMGPEGLEALRRMTDDADTYARHQAVLMLEEAGVLDDEVARIADDDPGRRAAAQLLVDRLVRDGQTARLRELAERHENPAVRAELARLVPDESDEATA